MCLLCHVDLVRTVAYAHTEIFRDALDGLLEVLERQLVSLADLVATLVTTDCLPEVLELTGGHQVRFDVVANSHLYFGDVEIFLI